MGGQKHLRLNAKLSISMKNPKNSEELKAWGRLNTFSLFFLAYLKLEPLNEILSPPRAQMAKV